MQNGLTLKLVVVQLVVVEAGEDFDWDADGNDDEVVVVVAVVVIVVESNCMAEDSSSIGTQPTVVAVF